MKISSIVKEYLTILFLAMLVCSCSQLSSELRTSDKDTVKNRLDELGEGLQKETWEGVEPYFDRGYYGGYAELRDQIENYWRNQDLMDIQFTIDRVLEKDGLLNAQVRWQKAFLDKTGRPKKKSGVSEVIFQKTERGLRILHIKNDTFF